MINGSNGGLMPILRRDNRGPEEARSWPVLCGCQWDIQAARRHRIRTSSILAKQTITGTSHGKLS
jgi:hypothetical protein